MFKFDKLIFGDLGWGDEFLIATLMTIIVSICSMGLGLFIAIFAAWAKLSISKSLKFLSNFSKNWLVVKNLESLLIKIDRSFVMYPSSTVLTQTFSRVFENLISLSLLSNLQKINRSI